MGARLGQHFLRSDAVLRDILAAADVRAGERILEVGPGRGVLTFPLAAAVGSGEVVAIEADRLLCQQLRPTLPPSVRLVHGDALAVDLPALGPFDRVVSNLPYQIAGPLVARLLEMMPVRPWHAVLLVQREFGARLLARPGTKTYGRLSVHCARWCSVHKIRDVSPGCFDPPPAVDSMVIRLEPRMPLAPTSDMWAPTVDKAFGQRRKKLRNTLPHAISALERLGLAELRPEQVSPESFAQLVEAMEA